MPSERFGNLGLNAALGLALVVVAVLAWSMGSRWFGGDEAVPQAPSDDHVQVDVRNGCGEPGLAARMAVFLRDRGFDVVEAGNFERSGIADSFVLDRVGNTPAAERVAHAVGLGPAAVRLELQNEYLLDATLVVGCDYRGLRPYVDDERP